MTKKRSMRLLLILILAAAIVPPILFGKERVISGVIAGDTWRDTIYDFQTLLGGLLAVAAAWWTVETMERNDAEQERRHRDLIALSLRPEYLALDRFVTRRNIEIAIYRDMCDDLCKQFKTGVTLPGILGLSSSVHALFKDVKELFSTEDYIQARSHLDGNVREIVQRTLQICDATIESAETVVNYEHGLIQREIFERWFQGDADFPAGGAQRLTEGLRSLFIQLRLLSSWVEGYETRLSVIKEKYPTVSI